VSDQRLQMLGRGAVALEGRRRCDAISPPGRSKPLGPDAPAVHHGLTIVRRRAGKFRCRRQELDTRVLEARPRRRRARRSLYLSR